MFTNSNSNKKHANAGFGAKVLSVRGRRFNNSAAKFWSALIDELSEEYAGCQSITLEALNEGHLDPELLFPEIELESDLNQGDLSLAGISEAWQEALADLELYGLPGSVGMCIHYHSGSPVRLTLPMDCVDAEIFLYLLSWLVEWSELPLSSWNEPEIKGAFSAADSARRLKYLFDFMIEHKPLSEGLFSWRLDLKFARSNISEHLTAKDSVAGKKNDIKKKNSSGT